MIRNKLDFVCVCVCAIPPTGSKACVVTKNNIIACLDRAMHPVDGKGKLCLEGTVIAASSHSRLFFFFLNKKALSIHF